MQLIFRFFLSFIFLVTTFYATAQSKSVPATLKIAMIESLSGPFGNTGEAVYRTLLWATERVNARVVSKGGVKFELKRYDSKGQSEEATSALRSAIDDGAHIIMQGNSSAVAAVLIDAINKHNERQPAKRVLFLNYSAIDPALTNEKCSP
ncbi:MAG: ABC transporter substrate-binding protein, partial [Polaromonas sp.]|nr:ABC transporter substrate-binding protein [Polaromonas sp.]